jgi:hypothetical protein
LAAAFGIEHADDGCGCVDTPLLQNPIERRSRAGLSLPHGHSVGSAAIVPAAAHYRCAACNRLTLRPPAVEQRLTSRRCVVLLV